MNLEQGTRSGIEGRLLTRYRRAWRSRDKDRKVIELDHTFSKWGMKSRVRPISFIKGENKETTERYVTIK